MNLSFAGKLIGERGRSITDLKSIYHVNIWLKGKLFSWSTIVPSFIISL